MFQSLPTMTDDVDDDRCEWPTRTIYLVTSDGRPGRYVLRRSTAFDDSDRMGSMLPYPAGGAIDVEDQMLNISERTAKYRNSKHVDSPRYGSHAA